MLLFGAERRGLPPGVWRCGGTCRSYCSSAACPWISRARGSWSVPRGRAKATRAARCSMTSWPNMSPSRSSTGASTSWSTRAAASNRRWALCARAEFCDPLRAPALGAAPGRGRQRCAGAPPHARSALSPFRRARASSPRGSWLERGTSRASLLLVSRTPAPTSGPNGILLRVGSLLAALAALLGVLLYAVRPWYMSWGATERELHSRLPGDELGFSERNETRAIAIEAPAEQVFSWVAQLGQDRGGFYSYELLEDLVGCEMPRLERLDPQLQHWSPGDKLWMYPPDKLGGMGYARLLTYEPGRALVFGTHVPGDAPQAGPSGTWSFVVQATGARSS